MSDRRVEDDNFIQSCKESQDRANKTFSLIDTFMSSILTSVRDLTDRVSLHERETSKQFKKVYHDYDSIKSEFRTKIDEVRKENRIGFSAIEKLLSAQSDKLDRLAIKEKKRSTRENWIRGCVYATVLSLAVTGAYFVGIQLFGEDRVQRAIDVSKGKIR